MYFLHRISILVSWPSAPLTRKDMLGHPGSPLSSQLIASSGALKPVAFSLDTSFFIF
jgi:hypothetical protein